ncbi:MAG: stage II sporulation protein P [Christensenellales bacterium]
MSKTMNKAWKKIITAVLAAALLMTWPTAQAGLTESPDDGYYTIYTREGNMLTMIAGRVSVDDEYISHDNRHYRIFSVNQSDLLAWAQEITQEAFIPYANAEASPSATSNAANGNGQGQNSDRKIAIYCTHSDESYVPSDGKHSDENYGGIYDVADEFAASLESIGIEVIQDYTSHLPHDSGAYRRSRATAVELLKMGPDALIDIHRDGVPAHQYETDFSDDDITMVRLLVGKNNQNFAANKNFAKELKANGDEMHPGLIKDIYIGKGNYNQELAPNSILLEFGTHETTKEQAQASTKYMAEVVSQTLYGYVEQPGSGSSGGGAAGQGENADSSGGEGMDRVDETGREPVKGSSRGWSGIWWVLGIAVGGGLIFLLYSKGGKRFGHNVGRSASELTGGLIGKKPDDEDKDEFDRE